MRLAIVNLTGGGLSGGGLKTMLHLVPRLREHPDVTALEVFVPRRLAELPALQGQPLRAWPAGDAFLGRRWLRQQLRAFRPDVLYVPNARWLGVSAAPTVVMVRNMEPLVQPVRGLPLAHGLRNLMRRHLARRACRRADRVIAVSACVRDFLVKHWRVPAGKIGVVHHGVEPPPPEAETRRPDALSPGDGRPFIFTAGTILHYRGLEDAIQAVPLLSGAAARCRLLIAGAPVAGLAGYQRRLKRLAAARGGAERIVWLGQLSPAEMSWCYHNAAAVVITSRIEACPNVALEAMGHGCLVAATSAPPMPEILADAAVYYEAGRPEEQAGRLTDLAAASADEQRRRKGLARRRSGEFSWDASAAGTLEELKRALEQRRRARRLE